MRYPSWPMQNPKPPLPQVSLGIERLNPRGRGIGSYQKPGAPSASSVEIISGLPGDELLVELGKPRRGKIQGRLKQVLSPSSWRTEPRCPHVPDCGGCAWQQMRYANQLEQKQKIVSQAFGSLLTSAVDVRPIIPCADPWNYRNKMEFSFSQNKANERFLGLMIAGAKGKVLNLTACHLSPPWFLAVLTAVRTWWETSSLAAYRMNDTGSLRTLTLREGRRTGDKMVILTVSGNPDYSLSKAQLQSFQEAIHTVLPNEPRLSLFLRVHQIQKGHPTQFYEMHLSGPDHIQETLYIDTGTIKRSLTFKISPTSFFQPNSIQAEILYSQALKLISFPKKHVLDLYAGTATLGMALALAADAVTAIELNPHAIFDAQSNKELNEIDNLTLLCGDVGKTLAALKTQETFIPPDLAIVDPPRSGLDPQALSHLLSLNIPEILYISCNPSTQALNIQELVQAGYALATVQPVDQFPHTVHIENIALLRKDETK